MAKVVNPIIATVEFITAPKEGQYGPYQSVLFKDETGEKIWKSFQPESEELKLLSMGAQVQLVPVGERNGKASHNIVLLDAPTTPSTAPSVKDVVPQCWTPEEKRAIATKIEQQSELLRFCLVTAKRKFGDLVAPEDIRALATTLFIQALK